MSFAFTHEQQPAINSLARLIRLVAFAGTGKTTTLVGYAQAHPQQRILYLCYNKSVEITAKEKFPLLFHKLDPWVESLNKKKVD